MILHITLICHRCLKMSTVDRKSVCDLVVLGSNWNTCDEETGMALHLLNEVLFCEWQVGLHADFCYKEFGDMVLPSTNLNEANICVMYRLLWSSNFLYKTIYCGAYSLKLLWDCISIHIVVKVRAVWSNHVLDTMHWGEEYCKMHIKFKFLGLFH